MCKEGEWAGKKGKETVYIQPSTPKTWIDWGHWVNRNQKVIFGIEQKIILLGRRKEISKRYIEALGTSAMKKEHMGIKLRKTKVFKRIPKILQKKRTKGIFKDNLAFYNPCSGNKTQRKLTTTSWAEALPDLG